MRSAPVVVTPEAATGTVLKMPITTLVLKEPATGLAPTLSETASAPTNTVHTIIERKFGKS